MKVQTKKYPGQPTALASSPETVPAKLRESAMKLVRRAYCVAVNRLSQTFIIKAAKAAFPKPEQKFSATTADTMSVWFVPAKAKA